MNAEFILICFMVTAFLVTLTGTIGTIFAAKYMLHGAERISGDISRGLAGRIERDIKRDIDNGEFFY